MIFRVHSPKSNCNCRGSLPVIIAYGLDNCVGFRRDAGPGVFFVSRVTGPSSSYFCCHRKSFAWETFEHSRHHRFVSFFEKLHSPEPLLGCRTPSFQCHINISGDKARVCKPMNRLVMQPLGLHFGGKQSLGFYRMAEREREGTTRRGLSSQEKHDLRQCTSATCSPPTRVPDL